MQILFCYMEQRSERGRMGCKAQAVGDFSKGLDSTWHVGMIDTEVLTSRDSDRKRKAARAARLLCMKCSDPKVNQLGANSRDPQALSRASTCAPTLKPSPRRRPQGMIDQIKTGGFNTSPPVWQTMFGQISFGRPIFMECCRPVQVRECSELNDHVRYGIAGSASRKDASDAIGAGPSTDAETIAMPWDPGPGWTFQSLETRQTALLHLDGGQHGCSSTWMRFFCSWDFCRCSTATISVSGCSRNVAALKTNRCCLGCSISLGSSNPSYSLCHRLRS